MAYLDNIAVFIRVVELGSLSSAGRDMRIPAGIASHRIKELEKHLGVRLFNRTTRQLTPTEHGLAFYEGAKRVLDAVEEAEAAVSALSGQPRGTIRVTAPLGLGRRLIASGIPDFHARFPKIEVRLRLSDHEVDLMREGLDVAFRLGVLEDSNLPTRRIMECERVLVASPRYLETHGEPRSPGELLDRPHSCLMLRYPGLREHYWTLDSHEGPVRLDVSGPYDSDDGDVLTGWALAGHGIINKPRFEVEPFIRDWRLKVILAETAPVPVHLFAVYPHRKLQDPKIRLLLDYMAERCQRMIHHLLAGK